MDIEPHDPQILDADHKSWREGQAEKPAYDVLKVENQVFETRKRWSQDWMLSEYVRCTDELIGKLDGTIPLRSDVVSFEDGKIHKETRDLPPPDSVVWLDKSARPVSWLKRELWSTLARTPGTPYAAFEIPPQPKDYYINFDKDLWLQMMGVPPEQIQNAPAELIDYSKIDWGHITRLRALFSTAEIDEDNLEEAWDHPTVFDGQHVMLVDEVPLSGRTLQLAQAFMTMAVPEATFSREYWAVPATVPLNRGARVNGEMQYTQEWVPVWYHQKRVTGRGVGDKDFNYPEKLAAVGKEVSRYAGVGRYMLSTPPHDLETMERVPDERGNALRGDIIKLGHDLLEHKVFYRPTGVRNPNDFEERVMAINGLTMDQWRNNRDRMAPKAL